MLLKSGIMNSQLGPDFDPTVDPEFNIIFEDKFISKIETQAKLANPVIFKRKNIIFSFDAERNSYWRRKFYPEYKMNRDTRSRDKDKFNIRKCFEFAYSNIIPKYCTKHGCKLLRCPTAESDDVIAVTTQWLLDKDKDNIVIILSSDRDYVQLCNDRVKIITVQNVFRSPKEDFMKMAGLSELDRDFTAEDFLMFKIILGDPSDNIPGIKYRVGPKKAAALILEDSRTTLKSLMKNDPTVKSGFARNKKLIAFSQIPKDLKSMILENVEEAFRSNSEDAGEDEVDIDALLN